MLSYINMTQKINSLKQVNFLNLPQGICYIIFDYSDNNIAGIAFSEKGKNLLLNYVKNEDDLTLLMGTAFLSHIEKFRDAFSAAVSKEIEERDKIEEKRPIKKSTLGYIASTLGLAGSAFAPYKLFTKAASFMSIRDFYSNNKNSIMNQLYTTCSANFSGISYAKGDVWWACTYNNLLEYCIKPRDCFPPCKPGLCTPFVNAINQCNSTLYSAFLSSCKTASSAGSDYGGFVAAGFVVTLALIGIYGGVSYWSYTLSKAYPSSIVIDENFLQKYSLDNEIDQLIFNQFIVNALKNKKISAENATESLNRVINQSTLEMKKYEKGFSQLPCILFKKPNKSVDDVVLEIKDENFKDTLREPLLRDHA